MDNSNSDKKNKTFDIDEKDSIIPRDSLGKKVY